MSTNDSDRPSGQVHCKYRSGEAILSDLLDMFRSRALGKYMESNNDPVPETTAVQQPLLPGWAVCNSSLEQNSINSLERPVTRTSWQR